ncbi:thioester reductase-like protein [Mycobacterium sp. BK086]|uniref:SDR family oxidoreductase n=1 Tax=Mycobacterium sp. BK086 TaxID=2512165 RepID=UPI00105F6D4F|nr:SDR family oxidoreductase [Mycobacterium sp. BK086]TDO07962.1 thioester reductase-like protein [Mycobacterium sp. BK086]
MSAGTGILITGAAGHVGTDVVARLSRRGRSVIALTHDRAVAGARPVKGDVRREDLGLDRQTVSELTGEVGLVVHSAAVTDFGLPEQSYTELNVDGTANALALARRFDAGFVYVSTTYVCGETEGTFHEDQLDIGQQFSNDYEHSKYRAEQLVRASGLRSVVVRPGIVTGEYRTGNTQVYKHIYQLLKVIVEGRLRTLPGNYAATLGLVPIGHVADVTVAAVERFAENVGRTFHAVGANSLSLRTISDVLAEYPCFRIPDFVPPATFSEYDLDDIERSYYQKVGTLYTSYLRRRLEFDSTNTRERLGLTPPAIGPGYFRRLLDSCLRTGYLGRPEPSVAEVLARLQAERSLV